MSHRIALLLISLAAVPAPALGQFPGTATTSPLDAATQAALSGVDPSALAASSQTAVSSVANAPPTLFDFLGFQQIGTGLKKASTTLHQLPVIQLVDQTVLHPIAGALGLKPVPGLNSIQPIPPQQGSPGAAGSGGPGPGGGGSGASAAGAGGAEPATAEAQQLTPPPKPEELAGKLKAEQNPETIAVKLEAIRFLAEQDCVCYPEVIDALLASLDDCAEPVRYEALRALRGGCGPNACQTCGSKRGKANGIAPCACQIKIIRRLSDQLLERDVNGRLKERSLRIRNLAQMMLAKCLATHPPADDAAPLPEAEPDPPLRTVPRRPEL